MKIENNEKEEMDYNNILNDYKKRNQINTKQQKYFSITPNDLETGK